MKTETKTMGVKGAALVLVVVTVLVGAVGYVALSAVASESTNTTQSSGCTPASGVVCQQHDHANTAGAGELIASPVR